MNITDMLRLERHRSTCNWISTYGFVENLAKSINAIRLCEVGVAYGYHAEHMLDHMPKIEYQGVDPYLANYDPQDPFVTDVATLYGEEPQRSMDRLFQAVNCKLTQYGGRANLLRKTSVSGAEMMSDGYFDIIYIDGDHTYDAVLKDLHAWYSKVKKGGILCGDDFNWPGVDQAVLDFMEPRGKAVIGHKSHGAALPEKWTVTM